MRSKIITKLKDHRLNAALTIAWLFVAFAFGYIMPMVESLVSRSYQDNQTISTQILFLANHFLHTSEGLYNSFIVVILLYTVLNIPAVKDKLAGSERKLNFVALGVIMLIATLSLMVCGALRLI